MTFHFGEYELDPDLFELRRAGAPCHVEPQVFALLAYLLEHRDRVVTKDEIIDHIWPDRFIGEAALSTRLMSARKAVGDSGRAQSVIRTVHGRGFRFVAEVTVQELAEAPPDATHSDRPAGTVKPALRLVSRATELEQLQRALDSTLHGRRQLLLIAGEAGIGKTALVEAFLSGSGQEQNLHIGWGQCLDHSGTAEAYMPVLDALGRLCRDTKGQEVVELLARRAPTWLIQLPWLVHDAALATLHARTLGATRERMLREMGEALEELSWARPVILVLEDLHWSDVSTLDLVTWLARRKEPARLLLIGTYRPNDVGGADHPLRTLRRELAIRGQCRSLIPGHLSASAVQELVEARYPASTFPDHFGELLHERTGGNPLFIHNLLVAWEHQGVLKQDGSRWCVTAPLSELAGHVPESLRQVIEQRLLRLPDSEREIFEAASVAGVEFPVASVSHAIAQSPDAVEEVCDRLARAGEMLRAGTALTWPDGTHTQTYGFVHSLYREVFYDRVPPGRRARLHRQIGERIEQAHLGRPNKPAVELAVHFTRGREPQRASTYLRIAAEQALLRSAHHEAAEQLTAAAAMLPQLPDGRERARVDLEVHALLAPALSALNGWGAPAVLEAYRRAWRLAVDLGVASTFSHVLYGLAAVHEYRGEYEVSEQLLARHALDARVLDPEAQDLLACSTFHQGKFAEALTHADQGLQHYDPCHHSDVMARHGENPGVSYHDWAALALWFLGRPEQAVHRARLALELAKDHRYSLATAQVQLAFLYQHRGEPELALTWAEAAGRVAGEQGFPFRFVQASIVRGWSHAALGSVDRGLRELLEGLKSYDASGAAMDRPYFLGLLADVYRRKGDLGGAERSLSEALDAIAESRPFYYEAELRRLWAQLLCSKGDAEGAGTCLERAIAVARRQGAKSLELRALMDVCALPLHPAARKEALQALGILMAEFQEGFDTPDLLRGRSLLAHVTPGRQASV